MAHHRVHFNRHVFEFVTNLKNFMDYVGCKVVNLNVSGESKCCWYACGYL